MSDVNMHQISVILLLAVTMVLAAGGLMIPGPQERAAIQTAGDFSGFELSAQSAPGETLGFDSSQMPPVSDITIQDIVFWIHGADSPFEPEFIAANAAVLGDYTVTFDGSSVAVDGPDGADLLERDINSMITNSFGPEAPGQWSESGAYVQVYEPARER